VNDNANAQASPGLAMAVRKMQVSVIPCHRAEEVVAIGLAAPQQDQSGGRRRKRRRGRRGSVQADETNQAVMMSTHNEQPKPQPPSAPANQPSSANVAGSSSTHAVAPKMKRRLLYKAARGTVSPTARQAAEESE
jgi:hypothetical protein